MYTAYRKAAHDLMTALGVRPFYLVADVPENSVPLNQAERQYIGTSLTVNAFTSPTADLAFRSNHLKREWKGRGFCTVFVESPTAFSLSNFLSIVCHELGHDKAVWSAARYSEDIEKALADSRRIAKPASEQHNRQWLRNVVHIWAHAKVKLGFDVRLTDIVNLRQYGYRGDDLKPLLKEADAMLHLDLDGILKPKQNAITQIAAPRNQVPSLPSSEPSSQIVNDVAVLPVVGVLDQRDYDMLHREFDRAIDSDKVKGIVFYVDSPGGSAIGCKRVADNIIVGRGVKPIVAYTQTLCGSAAFYIATACDKILATADALVGSLGSIFPHMEASGFFKQAGVTHTIFTNAESPKKGHGNIFEPLTDDSKGTLQNFVNSYGQAFVNDVARYRGLEPDQVKENYMQGDVVCGAKAIEVGMVDSIVGGFDEALGSIGSAASEHQLQSLVASFRELKECSKPRLSSYLPMAIWPPALQQHSPVVNGDDETPPTPTQLFTSNLTPTFVQ